VSVSAPASTVAGRSPLEGVAKLAAFVRRDFLVAWSYRTAFVAEWTTLALQVAMFALIGRLIDPRLLPSYGGTHASYMQFVSIGIAVAAVLSLGLGRVAAGMRGEQLMGTLEQLLLTPTSALTIQVGTVLYDLLFIPIRLAVFLTVVGLVFGLHFQAAGVLPALVFLFALIPFVWGLGIVNAASVMTFKRGGSGMGFLLALIALGSGAYFPLSVLPHWLELAVRNTPVALALHGIRQELIGGTGWSLIGWNLVIIGVSSLLFVVVGSLAFRRALQRERGRGSLGLY
jgi:ABC-2 type transport system permease protein